MSPSAFIRTALVLGSVCGVIGCGPKAQRANQAPPAAQTANERERCRSLGLKVYDDADCQAERKAEQARFLGKGGGS